mgnify:CR=1 FL=1
MNINELSKEQLEELRADYFTGLRNSGEDMGNIKSPRDIPMSSIVTLYRRYKFTQDNFYAN